MPILKKKNVFPSFAGKKSVREGIAEEINHFPKTYIKYMNFREKKKKKKGQFKVKDDVDTRT